jgi:hypothetical protein
MSNDKQNLGEKQGNKIYFWKKCMKVFCVESLCFCADYSRKILITKKITLIHDTRMSQMVIQQWYHA